MDAHIRHLEATLEANAYLYVRYLEKSVEIPVRKHLFKTKATVLSLLIRTSEVGREELLAIQGMLENKCFSLRFRRSPKKKFLNQISALVPVDDPLYTLKIREIFAIVAKAVGEEMPAKVVVGYHQYSFKEVLPGTIHHGSKAAAAGYKLGNVVGSMLRSD